MFENVLTRETALERLHDGMSVRTIVRHSRRLRECRIWGSGFGIIRCDNKNSRMFEAVPVLRSVAAAPSAAVSGPSASAIF